MTEETKKTEAKTEAKMTPGQLLREKRGLLGVLRKDIEQQSAIRKNEFKESLAASLSTRQKGVKVLRDQADKDKEGFKATYDSMRDSALKEYEESLAAITKKRDDTINTAHKLKEGEYQRINESLEKAAEPFITKHREETKELTEKYEKDEQKHAQSGEEAVKTLQEEILQLETELAKRAQAKQPQPEAAPAT